MGTSGEGTEVRTRHPPVLLLEVVYLRAYGPNARRSFPRPWRTADVDASFNKDAGIRGDGGGMSTGKGTETGSTAGGISSSSTGVSSSGQEPLRGDRADGRSRVASAVPSAGLLTGGWKARRSVPPAMSARCQLHPHALSRLGLRQGDPVLVFAGLEAGAARGTRASREEFSHGPGVRNPEPAGLGARNDGACATDSSRSYPMTPSDRHADGATHRGADAPVNGSAMSGVQEARAPSTNTSQGSGDRPTRAVSEKGDVLCFLCTAWANAFLAPTETAVDGRVIIPVTRREHATAGAARVRPETSGLGSERNGEQPYGSHSSSVAGALIGAFLEPSVAGAEHLPSAPVKRSRQVGVVPVTGDIFGACFGDRGYPDPPIAMRATVSFAESDGYGNNVSSSYPTTRLTVTTGSCKSGVASMAVRSPPRATQGTPASTTLSEDATSADSGASLRGVDGSSRRGRADVKGTRDPRLRPEYTWLVKRSLRHLVLGEGCIVAVPACPSDDAEDRGDCLAQGGAIKKLESVSGDLAVEFVRVATFTSFGDGDPSAPGSSGSRARTRSSPRTPHGSGVELGDRGSYPLGFLSARRLCVLGPDTTILVTQQESHGGGADLSGRLGAAGSGPTAKTPDRAADGHGSEGRFEEVPASRLGNPGPRTPTQALAELMLLPMTAPMPSEDGVQGLGFSIPRGVLLTGPPGVGKTFAVRSAVDSVRQHPVGTGESPFQVKTTTLNGAEVLSLGQWEACRALREAFDSATTWSRGGHGTVADARRRRCRRCAIIFLDEADALLTRRDLDGDRAAGGDGARALAQLLTLMDGFHKRHDGSSNVLIVGATNRPGALDPALRRPGRFDREVALAPPNEEERAEILRSHLEGLQVEGGSSTISEAAGKCVGYVGADLAALAREAALVAARRAAGQAELAGGDKMMLPKVGSADLAMGMEKVGASSLRGHQVSIPDTPWSAIGGMEKAKAKLRQAVEWPVKNKEAFTRMGLTAPRGILLYGPPGCSKTTLVRAAATAAGATFVCLSGADVFSPYLGEAEATIRQAFLTSRNAAPALLFFDEIDAIVANREAGGKGSSSSAESRVLATFLTEMDGVGALRGDGVTVVAATNRPEAVDKALLRPGRFDQLIYAPLPDAPARRKIFEVHTRKMVLDRSDVDFDQLASACTGLTGAEIEGVCREAAMSAIRETGLGGNVAGGASGSIRPWSASDGRDEQNLGEAMVQEQHGRAVVKHRHLLAASLAAAAKPGVSRAMVAGYERFGARC